MSILGTLGIIGAGISAGGSLGAAGIQAGSASKAQQLEAQQQAAAEQFLEQEYGNTTAALQPYLTAGASGVTSLKDLMSVPGQGLLQPWTQQFKAPTLAEAEEMPGYQFALQQGEQALQNSAAARGDLLSSGTQKNLAQFGQNAAETNYQDVYNNALQQYMQSYNQFQQNQQNQYNRLTGLAGIGQNATGQLANAGATAAGTFGNIALGGGAQQAQQINNRGGALASGVAGATNGLNSGLSNLGLLMGLGSNGYFGSLASGMGTGAPIGGSPGNVLNPSLLNATQYGPYGPPAPGAYGTPPIANDSSYRPV